MADITGTSILSCTFCVLVPPTVTSKASLQVFRGKPGDEGSFHFSSAMRSIMFRIQCSICNVQLSP